MNGEADLQKLLANMHPLLHEQPYVFCSLSLEDYATLSFTPLGSFHEAEGVTIIATLFQARQHDLRVDTTWAWITLTVHSSLLAVGFMAAITTQLAAAGISVNPVSAFYHDHLFIPWERRAQAMALLGELCGKNL
jgi:hypothetical protein